MRCCYAQPCGSGDDTAGFGFEGRVCDWGRGLRVEAKVLDVAVCGRGRGCGESDTVVMVMSDGVAGGCFGLVERFFQGWNCNGSVMAIGIVDVAVVDAAVHAFGALGIVYAVGGFHSIDGIYLHPTVHIVHDTVKTRQGFPAILRALPRRGQRS